MTKIKITAIPLPDGQIEVRTDIMGKLITEVMKTKEQVIRDALIALGWTPPDD